MTHKRSRVHEAPTHTGQSHRLEYTHTPQLHGKYLKKSLWTTTEQYGPEVRTDSHFLLELTWISQIG